MAEQEYRDSAYRFSDPVRYFKDNDPYYWEVDNIPLKQLQENCLWLRDQVKKSTLKFTGVKRSDIDELRPYATGGDRLIRVKPGRFTARINDATTKEPLAYLRKVMGEALGDVDAWATATPNAGSWPTDQTTSWNTLLSAALEKFQSFLAVDALGMNGLAERAFTWPVVNVDTPVDFDGVDMVEGATYIQYAGADLNNPGGGAEIAPTLVSKALLWAKSVDDSAENFALPSFETTNITNGWAKFPRTESWFIKRWRGIARTAIVDVEDEITASIPPFDADDFNYINEDGEEVAVNGVQSRIDLVFIYSKPVDASSSTILKPSGKSVITTPQLGVVKGAGIKANFSSKQEFEKGHMSDITDEHRMLASPGDQLNQTMGFNSTSANDIASDVRGSIPSPDDILNIAPLISEKLENEAYELVGQSILPVAYVWVTNAGTALDNGSMPVQTTDVIDIRPLFRTAELSYNERAGIAAALPQLSLANPAVGKGQLDLEIKNLFDYVNSLDHAGGGDGGGSDPQESMNTLAAGYVFGGWNFGPEGALWDFYSNQFGADDALGGGGADGILGSDTQAVRDYIKNKYGIGGNNTTISVPEYPDWDLAPWCVKQDIPWKGRWVNDYINTFFSTKATNDDDPSVVAGSYHQIVAADGTTTGGGLPPRIGDFTSTKNKNVISSRANFHFCSKRIKFNRDLVPWLSDYKVECTFLNCLPQVTHGVHATGGQDIAAGFQGVWVEKGYDEFVIHVAWLADDNNRENSNNSTPRFPAPHNLNNGVTISGRGARRFAGFVVPVTDILNSNSAPISTIPSLGYDGNPRIGRCTYPTIAWTFTGIPQADNAYLYGNLNGTNPTITLKSN